MALAEVDPGRGAAPRAPSYEDWYRAYFGPLRRRCARLVGDDATADDVAQEALFRAWQHRDRLDPDLGIYPWLCTVAQRLCVDVHRSRDRLVHLPDDVDAEDDSPGPGVAMEAAVDREAVRRALGSLPARHRRALVLREVEELPYTEVAARLGVSVGGARILLFRAREGLRSRLDAMSGGMAGVLVLLRQRIRRAGVRVADRVGAHEWTAHGAGMAIAPAAALLAFTTVLVGTDSPDPRPPTVTTSSPALAPTVAVPDVATPSPPTSAAVPAGPATGTAPTVATTIPEPAPEAPAPVTVDLDLGNDRARVSGAAPAPGGGPPIPFGAEVARMSDGSDSVVLGTADAVRAGTCGVLAASCHQPDGETNAEEAP